MPVVNAASALALGPWYAEGWVAIVAAVLGLVVALVAWYRDEEVETPAVVAPDWGPLPDPGDVTRVAFPMSIPGYDPATVEIHLETLARAYGDLLAVAPPDVVTRARNRSALRRGMPAEGTAGADPEMTSTALTVPGVPVSPGEEGLRTAVALADVEHRRHGRRAAQR
jgi:xanthine/uracil permease